MARSAKQDWKDSSGYYRRSLVENLMYRFKTLTGDRLWARDVDVQNAEVAVRVGITNRMLALVRPKSVGLPKTRGKGQASSSQKIYERVALLTGYRPLS